MDIYAAAILISLIVYIAVGNYAGRRVKKVDDYFVAGRNAPTILIVGTLVASLMSTNAFLGETGFVYGGQAGPYLLWPAIAASFTFMAPYSSAVTCGAVVQSPWRISSGKDSVHRRCRQRPA